MRGAVPAVEDSAVDVRLLGCLVAVAGVVAAGCVSGATESAGDDRTVADTQPWTAFALSTRGRSFEPIAANSRGQIVGVVEVPDERPKCCWRAAMWEDGRLIELPALGGYESRPASIDERGRIVGWSQQAPTQAERPGGHADVPPAAYHGVLWEGGRVRDLGRGTAAFITGRGVIFGNFVRPTRDAGVIDLPFAPAAVNSRGEVVGSTSRPADDEHAVFESVSAAYVWEHGRVSRLASLPGFVSCRADDANDLGQVAGVAMAASGATHLVRWDGGRMHDLGVVAAKWHQDVQPAHINAAGEVAVASNGVVGDAGVGAFLAAGGDLRRLPEQLEWVVDLDDEGRVLGSGFVRGARRGYVWQDGRLEELQSLPVRRGEVPSVEPRLFMEAGEILGTSNGRAVLWRRAETRR
jgi:probable HAF family extracellular repeat protein